MGRRTAGLVYRNWTLVARSLRMGPGAHFVESNAVLMAGLTRCAVAVNSLQHSVFIQVVKKLPNELVASLCAFRLLLA